MSHHPRPRRSSRSCAHRPPRRQSTSPLGYQTPSFRGRWALGRSRRTRAMSARNQRAQGQPAGSPGNRRLHLHSQMPSLPGLPFAQLPWTQRHHPPCPRCLLRSRCTQHHSPPWRKRLKIRSKLAGLHRSSRQMLSTACLHHQACPRHPRLLLRCPRCQCLRCLSRPRPIIEHRHRRVLMSFPLRARPREHPRKPGAPLVD